jgi:glycosyltransferase involved in cell wall biosynthesis
LTRWFPDFEHLPMKIAVLADFPTHCIEGFPGAVNPCGHFATWLPQIAESFERIPGLEVHWIVLSPDVSEALTLESFGQRFHVLRTSASGRATSFYREDRKQINRKLREIEPDLVHGWGSEDVHGFAAARSGYPCLISMQGLLTHYMLKNRMNARQYFCAWIEWRMLRTARYVTCESKWGLEVVRKRARRAQLFQVEYGVDPRFFSVKWSPDPDRKSVIFVGTLAPRKGVMDLIQAFADPKLAEVELWICGGGSGRYAKRMAAKATPNVKWLGYLSREETAERMARAWCLALPTRCDTSPNVVKEARTIGMPVVTTPCGGQSDYIEDGRNGFLVAPGGIRRLREALSRTVGELEFCRSLGAYRHEEQRAFFEPGRTGEAFARIYRELIAAQPKEKCIV